MSKRLASPEEQLFARVYALTHSSQRAAEEAGLTITEARRLLTLDGIKQQIDFQTQLHRANLEIKTDRITQELAAICFSDPGQLYTPEGTAIPIHELPPQVRAAIKQIDIRETEDLLADGTIRTKRHQSVTLHDKLKGIDIAARVKGLYERTTDIPTFTMDMGKAIETQEEEYDFCD